MLPTDLSLLLDQYIRNSISEENFKRLWKYLNDPSLDASLDKIVQEALDRSVVETATDLEARAKALAFLRQQLDSPDPVAAPVVPFYRGRVFRYAATVAAVIAGIAIWNGIGKNDPQLSDSPAVATEQPIRAGQQGALLTLADGTKVVLNDLPAGTIAAQGNVQVIKSGNGQLQYWVAEGSVPGVPAMNTMSTPRGGQYQLILPDGSQVWLNAESSITYPVVFTGSERKVRISGEAYFDIVKSKDRPFIVETSDEEVQVLGTQFNVNAYADEGAVKTTLLQGSVKVGKSILQPGQAYQNGKVVPTDVEGDVAWKNGIFNFNDKDLSQIMRQLARWYDLDVIYPDGIPKKEYGGEMGRNLDLQQTLNGLEGSGVRFELRGRKLIVHKK